MPEEQESQRDITGFWVLLSAVCLVVTGLCIKDGWFKEGDEHAASNRIFAVVFFIAAVWMGRKALRMWKQCRCEQGGPPAEPPTAVSDDAPPDGGDAPD